MSFANQTNGLIITKSIVQGGEKTTTSFRTIDDGINWDILVDTNKLITLYGSSLSMQYYYPDFAVDVTSRDLRFSNDAGMTWQNYPGYELTGLSTWIRSPSAYFIFADDITGKVGSFIVSNDTGHSYNFYGDNLYLNDDIIFTSCMNDTADVWITTKGSQTGHLLHTIDAGINWAESYPFDTILGGGNYYGELLTGRNKGTIYLYSSGTDANLMGWKTPAQRIIALAYTTDDGKSWNMDTTNHTQFTLIQNSGGKKLWGILDGTRTIAYSPDNGNTWAYDSLTFKDEPIWLMYWKDTTQGYILTYKDKQTKIYKWIPPQNNVENTVFFTVQDLKVYPVVAMESIKILPRISMKGTFEIYDILGRQYSSQNVSWQAKQAQEIDVSKLPSGVYLGVVRLAGDVSSVRFIKE
jgi:hypothetical protein